MASKYINPRLMEQTKALLLEFKKNNPNCAKPMYMAMCKTCPTEEGMYRYYRAAKQLGWDVCRQKGVTYENGLEVWRSRGIGGR